MNSPEKETAGEDVLTSRELDRVGGSSPLPGTLSRVV
jgi:hypothetical protein